jgi:hypothetical protein
MKTKSRAESFPKNTQSEAITSDELVQFVQQRKLQNKVLKKMVENLHKQEQISAKPNKSI